MIGTPDLEDVGPGRAMVERLKLILAIVGRDLRQFHRHGLVRMTVFAVLFIFVFGFLFSMAEDQLGDDPPPWTDRISLGGGGDPFLDVEIEADVYAGDAPLNVTFTPHVSHSEGNVRHTWYFSDLDDENGMEQEGPVTRGFTEPMSHWAYLVVEDDRGESVTSAKAWVLVVAPGDDHLQVAITSNRTEGRTPLHVQFHAIVVGGVPPYEHSWDFGDGDTSDETDPAHVFNGTGEHANVRLTVIDSEGNETSYSGDFAISMEDGGDGLPLPLTLLDLVYGLAVIITMVFIPMAFSSAYRHEMKKGTVRTLVCYPVGVLDVTVAKLIHAAIVSFIFAFVVFVIPTRSIDKAFGDLMLIFITAYLLTLVTVVIAAVGAIAMARVLKRMYFRPTALPYLAVWLAFIFTTTMLGGIAWFLDLVGVIGIDPAAFVERWAFAISMSPYHLGGEGLSAALGGPGELDVLMLAIPFLVLVAAGYLSLRVYPNVYEKE